MSAFWPFWPSVRGWLPEGRGGFKKPRMFETVGGFHKQWTASSSRALLAEALRLLDQPMPEDESSNSVRRWRMTSEMTCRDLRFRYSDDGPWVVDGVDLSISAGARVGAQSPPRWMH